MLREGAEYNISYALVGQAVFFARNSVDVARNGQAEAVSMDFGYGPIIVVVENDEVSLWRLSSQEAIPLKWGRYTN